MKEFLKLIFGFFIIIFLFFVLLKKVGAYQYELTNVEIVLSDCAPLATNVEYKFQFTTAFSLTSGQNIIITFPEVYSSPVASANNVSCPSNTTASVDGRRVICTVNPGATYPATTTEILVSGVTNPPKEAPFGVADIHFLNIETSAQEGTFFPISILETLTVTGAVHPILTFEVRGLEPGENFHQASTTVTTTASAIFFENIPFNIPILGAQDIFVTTNAGFGFILNIIQNKELEAERDGRIYRIYCFMNGNCRTLENALEWVRPEGILGAVKTYGHFGVSSEDNSLGEDCAFNYYGFGQEGKWVGPQMGTPIEVMRNCQPADGVTRHQGWTRIGFQVEVSPLQPAGNYETNFTYVLTPIF